MQLYQAHYVGRVKHEQYRTEYAALRHAELSSRRRWLYATMCYVVLLALIQIMIRTTRLLSRSAHMTSADDGAGWNGRP